MFHTAAAAITSHVAAAEPCEPRRAPEGGRGSGALSGTEGVTHSLSEVEDVEQALALAGIEESSMTGGVYLQEQK